MVGVRAQCRECRHFSAPMRSWPEPKAALARLIVRPVDVKRANGRGSSRARPRDDQGRGERSAGIHRFGNEIRRRRTRTGLVKPSIHNGSPAAAVGSVNGRLFHQVIGRVRILRRANTICTGKVVNAGRPVPRWLCQVQSQAACAPRKSASRRAPLD